MKSKLTGVAVVIVIFCFLSLLSVFVFKYWEGVSDATKWDCDKHDTVQITWIDQDQHAPSVTHQKQSICVIWKR
jgi:hypothetical protein